MKNKMEMVIIPNLKFHKFNEVSVNVKDINISIKVDKKRNYYSNTTSSY